MIEFVTPKTCEYEIESNDYTKFEERCDDFCYP